MNARRRVLAMALVLPLCARAMHAQTPNAITRGSFGTTAQVTIQVGRIIVVAADVPEVRYTVQEILPDRATAKTGTGLLFLPREDSTAARALGPYQGSYRHDARNGSVLLAFNAIIDPLDSRAVVPPGGVSEIVPGRRDSLVHPVEVRLEVPRTLRRLVLGVTQEGSIVVQDFDGEVIVNSNKGDVFLGRIGGSALVEARDGNISATVTRTSPDMPISLMSARGTVALWVPWGNNSEVQVSTLGGRITSKSFPITAMTPKDLATQRYQVNIHLSKPAATPPALIRLETLAGNVNLEVVHGEMPRWP